MNAGQFFVRSVDGMLRMTCTECDRLVATFDKLHPSGGTTLLVLFLDAAAHVRSDHPDKRWAP